MVDPRLPAHPLAAAAVAAAVAAALVAVTAPTARADPAPPVPGVYGRSDQIGATGVGLEVEAAVGSREARPFAEAGYEQIVRVRVGRGRVGVDVHGGVLIGQDRQAGGADVLVDVSPEQSRFRLGLGAGWEHDYRGADIIRARAVAGAAFGRTSVAVSVVGEVPLTAGRDAVDVTIGVAAGRAVTRTFSLGAEVVGEDLEGFVVEDEAEGGARLVAGPTAAWRIGDAEVRVLAGATAVAGAGVGGVGRVAVGARF